MNISQSTLSTEHWQYLHGIPASSGVIKSCPQDFQVTEIPSYPLTGEGEHIYLWIQKSELNTAFVAEQLARFTELPLRNISYAGRKDKYALTEQYFGVHLPGNSHPDWRQFELEGTHIISAVRHNKKLRTGALKGNHFNLTVRDISEPDSVNARLNLIAGSGVPNYYGEQRFGNQNSNLHLAQKLIQGETIRNRNKRSMCISALRSWLFNQTIHQRLEDNLFDTALVGDVMKLAGTNSFFVSEHIDEEIQSRLATGDIQLSAPLWGIGQLASEGHPAEIEQSVAAQHQDVATTLEKLKMNQERRAINLRPANLNWQFEQNILTISFDLPPGCFATSVLRELMQIQSPANKNSPPNN